jgi:hypothetical protein
VVNGKCIPAQKVHPSQHSGYGFRESFELIVDHGVSCRSTAREDSKGTGTRRSSQGKGVLRVDSRRQKEGDP